MADGLVGNAGQPPTGTTTGPACNQSHLNNSKAYASAVAMLKEAVAQAGELLSKETLDAFGRAIEHGIRRAANELLQG